jgi:hypothetical protein
VVVGHAMNPPAAGPARLMSRILGSHGTQPTSQSC